MGQFHTYSVRNQVLIMIQHPTATLVAGYKKWEGMGRHVMKGEKAIDILAPLPCRHRVTYEDEVTGEERYLRLSKFFIDERGTRPYYFDGEDHPDVRVKGHEDEERYAYHQANRPVREQTEATGHAVRAVYLYSGMADVAALTGDQDYLKAIDAIYDNIVSRKYYITGGVGARHQGEAFGADYELPNLTAYNETCAAISMVYLFHRMFLLHGDAKYIDCLERTLYNGVISGMSVDGGRFFYPNPLSSDGQYKFNADGTVERQPWFGCACCPSNLCRFIPSFPGYMYAVKDRALYVNLFAGNTATVLVGGKDVVLEQTTNYPWDGDVTITVDKNAAGRFALKIRIPGWLKGQPVPSDLYQYTDNKRLAAICSVNGNNIAVNTTDDGYLTITRKWKKGDRLQLHFDMEPRTVRANHQVEADRGMVAIERGPLVYCAEGADNAMPHADQWPDHQGASIFNFLMPRQPRFTVTDREIKTNSALTFGVKAIQVDGQVLEQDAQGEARVKKATLTMIPYYAWNHRGPGLMEVWMPQTLSAVGNY